MVKISKIEAISRKDKSTIMHISENKLLLEDLYLDKKLSMSDIGVLYGAYAATVRGWLLKNGIPSRQSTQTIYRELKEASFSDSQKSLIIGSVLGDGSLTMGKDCRNARFIVRHGETQKDYLFWKRDMLKPFTKSKIYDSESGDHIISGVKCHVNKSYVFSTISHPWLTDMKSLFYNNGVKSVPSNISEIINNLSVAIWLCDDGCFTYNKKFGIYRLDLHTESFTYEENVFLCREVLSKMFGVGFRINSRIYKSGKAFYICLSGKDLVKKIVSEVYMFVPTCMQYKFKYFI